MRVHRRGGRSSTASLVSRALRFWGSDQTDATCGLRAACRTQMATRRTRSEQARPELSLSLSTVPTASFRGESG
eukprot:1917379-Rhodomonas_salina.1